MAPTEVAEARMKYPHLAERFVAGNLFDPPAEMRGAFDVVLEHTCISALPFKIASGTGGSFRGNAMLPHATGSCNFAISIIPPH